MYFESDDRQLGSNTHNPAPNKKHHHLLIAHHILLNMLCETLFAPQIAAIDRKWKSNVKEKAPEKVSAVKTLNLVLRREKHLFELVKTYNHRLCYPVNLMALWLFNICIKWRKGEQRSRVEWLNQHVPQRLRFFEINCGIDEAFKTRFGKIIITLGGRQSSEWRWWEYFFGFFSAQKCVGTSFCSLCFWEFMSFY